MSKKDFFRVMIKVFGLYSVIVTVFQLLPTVVSYIGYQEGFSTIFYFLIPTLFLVALFLILIFRADKIIDWLKLERGFDTKDINLGNLSPKKLVSIIIILIGGWQILSNISFFLVHGFLGFKEMVQTKGIEYSLFNSNAQMFNLNEWIISAINLTIGVVLISNYQNISKWIQKMNNKNKS